MSWPELTTLSTENLRPITDEIVKDLDQGTAVFPAISNWLRAFDLTPLEQVKVVIVGQDPYPTAGHATGLAFSVDSDIKLPPSLRNIFKELKDDTGTDRTDGDLTDWATQGVLLLNTSLTVAEGRAGSHSKIGWNTVAKEAIELVSAARPSVVFILWGKHAQQFVPLIDQHKHQVIMSAHPSPLSASRGFFGSQPFSKTNQFLEEHHIDIVRW